MIVRSKSVPVYGAVREGVPLLTRTYVIELSVQESQAAGRQAERLQTTVEEYLGLSIRNWLGRLEPVAKRTAQSA